MKLGYHIDIFSLLHFSRSSISLVYLIRFVLYSTSPVSPRSILPIHNPFNQETSSKLPSRQPNPATKPILQPTNSPPIPLQSPPHQNLLSIRHDIAAIPLHIQSASRSQQVFRDSDEKRFAGQAELVVYGIAGGVWPACDDGCLFDAYRCL